MTFTLSGFIKRGLLSAVGKMADYQIILNAAGWLEKGVLSEDDMMEIQAEIDAQYVVEEPETVYGGTLDVETGVVNTTWGHIASYAGEALPGEWISDRDVYSSGAVPTTGAQVVYKLAEPYTIQLTPQQIAALSGVNTLYTDADGVIVTGAEDPKHTITELKNAIISLGGNV